MILTNSILNQGKSKNGAWNKKQLLLLRVEIDESFNLRKGWKARILGNNYPESTIKRFIELKNTHLEETGELFK